MFRFFYRILADLIFAVHMAWILLLVSGTVYIFFNRGYIKYHLIIVTGTLVFNLFLRGCPLTRWEGKLRAFLDSRSRFNNSSFVATYLERFFGKKITASRVNCVIAAIKVVSYGLSGLLLLYR